MNALARIGLVIIATIKRGRRFHFSSGRDEGLRQARCEMIH
jgi:hypothetical protein